MDFSESNVCRAAKKSRGKPFRKGISGNPKGKRKGTRNAATVAAESLLDGESEALVRKAIEMALGGDMAAMRLVIERILPPRRLPPLQTAADAMTAISRIAESVGQGELSEGESRTLIGLVHTFLEGLEQVQTDLRLAEIDAYIPKIATAITNRNAPEKDFTTFSDLMRKRREMHLKGKL